MDADNQVSLGTGSDPVQGDQTSQPTVQPPAFDNTAASSQQQGSEPTVSPPATAQQPEIQPSVTQPVTTTPSLTSAPEPTPVGNGPAIVGQIVVGGSPPVSAPMAGSGALPTKPAKKHLSSLLLIIVGAVVLLGGGSAAAYFGYYVPNSPTGLWSNALGKTAAGYDVLVAYSQQEQKQNFKGSKTTGSFKASISGVAADGTLTANTYNKDGNATISVGFSGVRYGLQMLLHTPAGADNPDVYLKASGLNGLSSLLGQGDPTLSTTLGSLDNQWFVVDHTLIDQEEQNALSSKASSALGSVNAQDILAIEQAFGRVNRQYVFTTQPSKAILSVSQKIGKEQVNGRSAYHYKVGYNKSNLKDYVTALKDAAKQTKINDLLSGKNFEDASGYTQLESTINGLNGKGSADVWVDTGTKLVTKIQFTDSSSPGGTIAFGQSYTGGDSYPFFFNVHTGGTDSSDSKIQITLNTKTNVVSLDASSTSSQDNASFQLTTQPSNDQITFTQPAGAKSLTDLINNALGQFGAGAINSKTPVSSILPFKFFN